jgi:hypothetical protein
MYIKTEDQREPTVSRVRARLGSAHFAGHYPYCSGGLGLEGIGSLTNATSMKSLSQRNARADALRGPKVPQAPFNWEHVWHRSQFLGSWPTTSGGSEARAVTVTTLHRPAMDVVTDVRKAIERGTLHTRAKLNGVYVDKDRVTYAEWVGLGGKLSIQEHEEIHLKITKVAAQWETKELGKIEQSVISGGREAEAYSRINALFLKTDELHLYVQRRYDFKTGMHSSLQRRWSKPGHINKEFDRAVKLRREKPEKFEREAKRYGVLFIHRLWDYFLNVMPLHGIGLAGADPAYVRVPIANMPMPCRFYTIKSGVDKEGLIDLAGRAYGVKTNKTKLAQWINNHPYNRRFWRTNLANKSFPQGRISFNPRFSRDISKQAQATGHAPSGNAFATIFIPPPPVWLQKMFPSCSNILAK